MRIKLQAHYKPGTTSKHGRHSILHQKDSWSLHYKEDSQSQYQELQLSCQVIQKHILPIGAPLNSII